MDDSSAPIFSESSAVRLPLQEHNDAFKSRTKTASKAQRVTVENSGEAAASPLYKILRSGKRILQTPARAARVAVEQPTTTIKKASRVPLTQEPGGDVENLGDNDEKLTDASVEASASEQTADGVTDPEADSSWLVSTETVPVVTSEAEDIADKTTAQDSPDESPVQTGYDACLAEMYEAGLMTKSTLTYSCDTDAVAASHGLVNMYSPLPVKTPQNTPAVKEQTVPQKLQLLCTDSEVEDVPSPPSSSRVHPSSYALDDSFSLDCSPAPTAPAPKHLQSSTPTLDASLDAQQTPQEVGGIPTQDTSAAAFIPRQKATPFMERKLRDIKAKEWSADDGVKVHKSKLERMKEEAAAAARLKSMSSADKTLVRRLVQQAVGKAVKTDGKDLGEGLVKHKSRLEKEKEAATERAATGTQGGKAKKNIAPSSGERQGLSAMKAHKSRLEREREEAAARRAEVSAAGQEKPLPSYMRATKASIAMKKEGSLGDDMKVHKSQLERDRDAALAAQAARKIAGVNPLTPFPHKGRRSEAASAAAQAAFGGHGLGSMPVHKSALEKEKEAVAKNGAGLPKRAPRPPVSRATSVPAGGGLGDMKVHKSRLQKDKEAWDKAAAAHAAAGKVKPSSGTLRQATSNFMPPTEAFSKKAGAVTPSKEEDGFSSFVPN
ncbi:hypothetical protein WJX75_001302 [Coccomyxa subellipsoidea]|uniref:Uncharacterized protein n=1 Tax=Coccomyxa subellipsoidea TaxID=248742 RepID=A0ABR2YLW3_9CHLO